MSEYTPSPRFEEDLRSSFGAPEIRPAFVEQVHAELMRRAENKLCRERRPFGLRPAWAGALLALLLLAGVVLAVGPQRVYAAVSRLLGYIPGIGLVEQDSPLRVLAQPVSVTRRGITVSVNRALLTPVETRIDFGVSGVPLSAYPPGEAVSGCLEHEYLRLPDGSRLEAAAPLPSGVNEAVFVLPCIFNTLPDAVPQDWELPLRFIPAPPELTVLPVLEVTPQASATPDVPAAPPASPAGPTPVPPHAALTVDRVIETDGGYILLGAVRPSIPQGAWLQATGAALIRDAHGAKVNYTFPEDIQPPDDPGVGQGGFTWVMQIQGAGVSFPVTIRFSGVILSPVDPQASARLSVDVGPNPQPGQVWEINRDVSLAGHTVRLLSLSALEDGYSLRIDPGPGLSGVSVEIENHPALGAGGGGGWGGAFNTSLAYAQLPAGELSMRFFNPQAVSPAETWETQWQPQSAREFPPASSGACLDAAAFPQASTLPPGLNGTLILTQLNPQVRILLSGMHGEGQRVIAEQGHTAALSTDGSRLAYAGDAGLSILHLSDGVLSLLPLTGGREPHWSPDGSLLALVSPGGANGIFVVESRGQYQRQLSNLGYESIAGWSPDGTRLVYAIPAASQDGFLLRSVEVNTGETRDLFVLENSSRKAPMPALSPDGTRIAYRASDNSSLYLKGMDGSPARLLLEAPAGAINGVAWEPQGRWLGVSLVTPQTQDGETLLINPDSCETYRLPLLSGALNAVIVNPSL